MKHSLTLLVLLLSTIAYSQTPITDDNIKAAIDDCRSYDSENCNCPQSEYGRMADWDVSNVTNMKDLFRADLFWNNDEFNGNISNWDVSNVTNMTDMFSGRYDSSATGIWSTSASGIGNWDVSSVTNMEKMFSHCLSNTQDLDLSNWDVSSVTNMVGMFVDAKYITTDVSLWDVANVTKMNGMFSQANNMNPNLGDWSVEYLVDAGGMLTGTAISTENYDNLLVGWASQELSNNIDLSVSAQYCNGASAREIMTDLFNWNINDQGLLDSTCVLTSINDIQNNAISVYPNPVLDVLHIDSNVSNVSIYNLVGAKVIDIDESNSIDISNLINGTYVAVITDGITTSTSKFIKQ